MTVCWQKSGAMNPKHILWVAILVGVAACSEYRTQQKLDDLSWGQPFKGEYDDVLARAAMSEHLAAGAVPLIGHLVARGVVAQDS